MAPHPGYTSERPGREETPEPEVAPETCDFIRSTVSLVDGVPRFGRGGKSHMLVVSLEAGVIRINCTKITVEAWEVLDREIRALLPKVSA